MCIWKLQFVLFHRCSCVLYCPGMSALCALSECVNIRQEQICAFTHRLTATCCMREHTAQSRVTNSYSRGELWKNFVLKYIHWVRPNTLSTLIFAASIHCVICITSSYSRAGSTSKPGNTRERPSQSTIIKCHASTLNIGTVGMVCLLCLLFFFMIEGIFLIFFFLLAPRLLRSVPFGLLLPAISREWVMKLL